MKYATRSILWTAIFVLAAPVCFSQAQNGALEHKIVPAKNAKKPDDPFLNGAPFTFDQLLRLLGEDAIPLHRRQQAIRSRGLDFSLSAEKTDRLKAAGASADTLEVIKSKAKAVAAAPPAPPKPPPTGGMTLNCAPAECDISLNGTRIGSTQNGKLEVAQLTPGKWIVDFKKTGYIGSQNAVAVEADRSLPVSAVLEPTHAMQEALGAELLNKIVQAVGGADGIHVLATVQASGSATVLAPDGKSVRWTVLMRNRPDRALFQARAGGGVLYEITFVGNEYRASKNLKGPDALELPTDFGFVRDYQLSAVFTKLSDPQFKILTSHPTPVSGEEFALVAESGTEKISMGLDSEMRPQKVRITTVTGVGSALIIYGDYFKKDKVSYPKTLQIKLDGRQQGIDVRFDSVELNPNLGDNDYKQKGKPLLKSDD